MPNGYRGAVLGVEIMKIKIFRGAVRILGGVTFVPKLHENLISLSQVDFKGCTSFVAGGVLEITRG